MISCIHAKPSPNVPRWEVSIRNIYNLNGKECVIQYWTQQSTPIFLLLHSRFIFSSFHVLILHFCRTLSFHYWIFSTKTVAMLLGLTFDWKRNLNDFISNKLVLTFFISIINYQTGLVHN